VSKRSVFYKFSRYFMTHKETITRISGPLVEASGMAEAKMFEVVQIGNEKLLGEVISLDHGKASIQVYEDTAGLTPGEPVFRTGTPLSVELGPGLLGSIYDGIQRPLSIIAEQSNSFFINRGIEADGIDRAKKWDFKATAKVGDVVVGGDIIGEVQETSLILHKVMIPPTVERATIKTISSGTVVVEDTIATIEDAAGNSHNITLLQKWPIRNARPIKRKIFPFEPLMTGGRSIDTFFPLAKGGVAAIPGPFGSGKTVTQQGLAKYCDAQVIVYIGCGERGNEMTEVLNEFPHLIDPNTGEPLIRRTVLIANTSNMPVAAREASVYTGITIAEYYRDMGYSVALMADSTSRWAEAMREISGRMEEMPGEEGYPAYLSSRTAEFYERAGLANLLGSDNRTGALTVIGAVSPPGGDLSEPVSQATLRVTKTYWGLDAGLAYKKHFPTINWLKSYSLYSDNVKHWWAENIAPDFAEVRQSAMDLMQQEDKLMEIVRLVGLESVSDEERVALDIARAIREDFLFQNAFDPEDAYTPLKKQYGILSSIITVHKEAKRAVETGAMDYKDIAALDIMSELATLKNYPADKLEQYDEFKERVRAAFISESVIA
jgi:V/A-type H+-transporting ATPase subunit A